MSEFTYTKSITSDFGGNLNIDNLQNEIIAQGLTPILVRIDRLGDSIDVVFDSELSAGEQTILNNTVIPNHNNEETIDDNLSVNSIIYEGISSNSYIDMDSMTLMPESGTYIVNFSSSAKLSLQNNTYEYAIFKAGIIVQQSNRILFPNNNNNIQLISTQSTISVNGSESINIKYKTTGGTFTVYERNLILTPST
jgi:hypothetical protein